MELPAGREEIAMTVMGIVVAICVFSAVLFLITKYVPVGTARNILLIIVVVLAVVVLLAPYGLFNLLNTPVSSPGNYPRR